MVAGKEYESTLVFMQPIIIYPPTYDILSSLLTHTPTPQHRHPPPNAPGRQVDTFFFLSSFLAVFFMLEEIGRIAVRV